MDYSNEVLRIVEGALKSDKAKVVSYTKLLVEKLKENNEERVANSFIKLLSSSSVMMTQLSSSDNVKIPIDQESRLPMADILQPLQASDVKVVLNKYAFEQVEKFFLYYENLNKLINSGIHVPNAILLYGPPGCGKNKLAEFICQKIKLPLVTVRLDGMISSYLGSTSKNIRAIFEYAQAVPCILFLDEFDAIAKVRDDNNELGELKRVVNSLLQNIDNLKNGSVIIAATNHEHLLDPAVWRRFGFKISIDKPDFEARKALFELFLENHSVSDKNIEIMSVATEGLSGAEIEEICNKSTIDSILQGNPVSLTLIFYNIFDLLNVGRNAAIDNIPIKAVHREYAKHLRVLNEKVFSYSQIALILGVSKSYISDLLRVKETDENE